MYLVGSFGAGLVAQPSAKGQGPSNKQIHMGQDNVSYFRPVTGQSQANSIVFFNSDQEEHCISKDNAYRHIANTDSGMDFITRAYNEQMYGSWLAGGNRIAVLKIMRFSQVRLYSISGYSKGPYT